MKPREHTPEEVREIFLTSVWKYIELWEREPRAVTSKEKLEGLAHSVLSMIDGSHCNLPAFILAPLPCFEDKAYCKGMEENYFPYNARDKETGEALKVKSDIGGHLAYEFCRVGERLTANK